VLGDGEERGGGGGGGGYLEKFGNGEGGA